MSCSFKYGRLAQRLEQRTHSEMCASLEEIPMMNGVKVGESPSGQRRAKLRKKNV